MNAAMEQIFALSPDVRYVALYRAANSPRASAAT
jgi:hypothetical protein